MVASLADLVAKGAVKMIFGRIEWYLARSVVFAILSAMLLLTALLGFSELLSQMGRISDSYPLSKAAIFALLKMPAYSYDVFPMAVLIGVLAGLGQLAVQGELTIIRASGWSPTRLMLALSKGIFFLWLLMLLVGEVVSPWAESTAMQLRLSSGAHQLSLAGESGFWMKEGSRYMSARTVAQSDVLLGVEVFEFSADGRLSDIIQAERAVYEAGDWQLRGVRIQRFGQEMTQGRFPFERLTLHETRTEQTSIHFPFEPETLALMAQDKKNWSMLALKAQMAVLASNGMQTQTLELALWRKFAHPISILAMLVVAVPLLLRAGRSASMGGRILMGIVIGLVFFLLNRVVGDMSALANLPPVASAMGLPIIMLLLGGIWLRRLR